MRLETQLAIVQQAQSLLPGAIAFQSVNNMSTAGGKTQLRQGLELLKQLPYFSDEALKLLAFGTFTLLSDEIALTPGEVNRFNGLFMPLRAKVDIIVNVLSVAVPEHTPYTVAVRLPPFDSFGQLETLVHTFGLIFNQTMGAHPEPSELRADIAGFDIGSNYLLVYLGAELGVRLVARLAQAAHYIIQQLANASALRQHSRVLKAKGDMAEKAAELFKAVADDLYDEQAEAFVQAELGGIKEGEDKLQRMVNVMRDLVELVNRGADIQPLGLASPDIKLEFPDPSKALEGLKPKQIGPSDS
jgi:hypothetical protein